MPALQSHSELHILSPVGSEGATRLEDMKPGFELTIYPIIPSWCHVLADVIFNGATLQNKYTKLSILSNYVLMFSAF